MATADVALIVDGAPLGTPFAYDGWVDAAQRRGLAPRAKAHTFSTTGSWALSMGASLWQALACVANLDSVVGCALAIAYTCLYWYLAPELHANLSWNMIALAVVFPLTQGIGQGFKRREHALSEMGMFLGNLRAVWGAAHSWLVKDGATGEHVRLAARLDAGERAQLHRLFDDVLLSLIAYFDTERGGRARQQCAARYPRHCAGCGLAEADEVRAIATEQRLLVECGLSRLQRLVQDFKLRGLPGGEAHRLDSYVSKMHAPEPRVADPGALTCSVHHRRRCAARACHDRHVSYERLAALKEYRTPHSFRAFARLFILFIGALQSHARSAHIPQSAFRAPCPLALRRLHRSLALKWLRCCACHRCALRALLRAAGQGLSLRPRQPRGGVRLRVRGAARDVGPLPRDARPRGPLCAPRRRRAGRLRPRAGARRADEAGAAADRARGREAVARGGDQGGCLQSGVREQLLRKRRVRQVSF